MKEHISDLNLATVTVLAKLCRDNGHTRLHGMSQKRCLAWFREVTRPVLNNDHVRNGFRKTYDGVLGEWARLFTNYDGPELKTALVRCLTVWSALCPGLVPMMEECLYWIQRRLRQDKEVNSDLYRSRMCGVPIIRYRYR